MAINACTWLWQFYRFLCFEHVNTHFNKSSCLLLLMAGDETRWCYPGLECTVPSFKLSANLCHLSSPSYFDLWHHVVCSFRVTSMLWWGEASGWSSAAAVEARVHCLRARSWCRPDISISGHVCLNISRLYSRNGQRDTELFWLFEGAWWTPGQVNCWGLGHVVYHIMRVVDLQCVDGSGHRFCLFS